MNANTLETEVLNRVAEDYEAPHTIIEDIARKLKRPVSEKELLAVLLALAHEGSVQAYVYEPKTQRYRPVGVSEAATVKDPWFMARRPWACRVTNAF